MVFFFQAEDGIRDLVRSRGLGDVYKRQSRDDGAVSVLEGVDGGCTDAAGRRRAGHDETVAALSLIHI